MSSRQATAAPEPQGAVARALDGLDPDVLAPMRLGMGARAYRTLIARLADAFALTDAEAPETVSAHQRAADEEEAEWFVAALYAAGYVPRRQRPSRPRVRK